MATTSIAMPTSPLVEGNEIRPEWRAFLAGLMTRTGGTQGSEPTNALQQQLAAETAARTLADQALHNSVTTVAGTAASNVTSIQAETARAEAAEAQLLPKNGGTTGAIGFQFAPPIYRPTVTGAKAGNAALASLLAALASYGLITDAST